MSILAWIALGAIGGLGGGWLLRSRGRALLGDLAVGVLGAISGGFCASVLLGLDVAAINFISILVAVLGAALLILVLHSLPSVDVFE